MRRPRLEVFVVLALVLGGCTSDRTSEALRKSEPAAVSLPRGLAPQELVGRQASDLRRLLGEPDLIRREVGAEVWQYPAPGCVLFLYLYDNGKGAREVTYLEARAKTRGPVPTAACIAETVRARTPPTS